MTSAARSDSSSTSLLPQTHNKRISAKRRKMFYYFLRELGETGSYGRSEGVFYTLTFLAAVGKAPRRKMPTLTAEEVFV